MQLLLGHAGIQTTTVYLQFKNADLREVYENITSVTDWQSPVKGEEKGQPQKAKLPRLL
ncbi:MAG: hypothetical protein WCE81_04000 [Halobacteriota archaeon]